MDMGMKLIFNEKLAITLHYNANAGAVPAFSASTYLDKSPQNAFHGNNNSAQLKCTGKNVFLFSSMFS